MSGARGLLHESARGHVSGQALYTDEQREPVGAGTTPASRPLDSAVDRGNRLLRDFEAANK